MGFFTTRPPKPLPINRISYKKMKCYEFHILMGIKQMCHRGFNKSEFYPDLSEYYFLMFNDLYIGTIAFQKETIKGKVVIYDYWLLKDYENHRDKITSRLSQLNGPLIIRK